MDANISIIGAGVIGLAIAERLSLIYNDIFLIEKHPSFGQETSSRNSEVIHAGIYYTKDSLKAKLCVEGNRKLYDYCRKWDIPFKNCGKLIVATSHDELKVLDSIKSTAAMNGVHLEILEPAKISQLEPEIFALGALWSPTTGVIDSHSLMKRFETNFLNNGGQISYQSEVKSIEIIPGGYKITVSDGEEETFSFSSKMIINSAGLYADKVSEMAGISDSKLKIQFCKGEYFRICSSKSKLINRLIYPVPYHNLDGVGIHVTIDTGGGVKLGPDVTYLNSNICDYKVDGTKKDSFWKSARKFLPFLEPDDLMPEMAGIRPKLQKPGESAQDFYIREESSRSLSGFVNLIGMESPGLTSCLAIADYVSHVLQCK